jgi:hypothetical protein
MRIAILLMCLTLAGCAGAGGKLPGEQPAPAAAASAAPSGARPAASAQAASAPAAVVEVGPDVLTQARVDCWMKVEHQKGLRNIDKRIAFVDKCVDDEVKAKQQ